MVDYPDRVSPHLHICLQSGSDAVLRRMKRRWGTQRFLDRCQFVKEHLDRPALTTDVIVGFPGETEDEFEQTLETCRQAGFSKIHMFPFSARKGTPAAEMTDAVSPQVKSERGKELGKLEVELRKAYHESLIGMDLQVLVEGHSDEGRISGTSCRYATVELPSTTPVEPGTLVRASISGLHEDRLLGLTSPS